MKKKQEQLERHVKNTMWTPLKYVGKKNGEHVWLMRCKCGTEKEVNYKNYKTGKSLTCGCYRKALGGRGGNRLPIGESARNQLLLVYKRGAIKRGMSFTITKDTFLRLTSMNCHYCGHVPSSVMNRARYTGKGNGAYIYNGIDRIDSNIGYVSGNCVSCCRMCNFAKSDMEHEDFIQWLDNLVEFRNTHKHKGV